ncbi:peptidoglycan endopeptidase [Qipengyuania sp. YIM B01966]|uniref:peptidoglycan endopeptidase n=1 Tax=Qipengyuania sp. YIM B01966 TaxID=2778646 RepID=UPI0018F2BEC1|nr:peptidoglycan endopeptidase [Qipengyuania sp. YIM B01966]
MTGAAIAAAAAALVGTPYRAEGRAPGHGLDCLGVVLAALRGAGIAAAEMPSPPGWRQTAIDEWLGRAAQVGLRPASGAPIPGDVLLVASGPGQHHLLIVGPAGDSCISAHAGLGQVVASPLPAPATLRRHWRMADNKDSG